MSLTHTTGRVPEYAPADDDWPPEYPPDCPADCTCPDCTTHDYWCNCRPCTQRAADAWADAIAPLTPPF